MNERVLCVCGHADDDAIGCGATLAKHAADGDELHVLVMADGVTARKGHTADEIFKRMEDGRRASQILGISDVTFIGLADNKMDAYPELEITRYVEQKVNSFRPTIVYTHWPHDLNVDHRVTSRAVSVACRPVPECSVKRLLFFEVVSSTEWQTDGNVFAPNWFVDVNIEQVSKKINALNCYSEEMREWPHARSFESIDALMRIRGTHVGVKFSEAFIMALGIV